MLKAQASIFPKIILLDKKLDEKLVEGKIILTIIYDKEDYHTAVEIYKYIKQKYKNRFETYEYIVNLVEFSDVSYGISATAMYVLNSDKYIENVADIAKKKGIITFAYDINNLKNGLLFSLMLEKSTILYINKENLYSEKVDFVESLLQMVHFIN